jgi:hypothetical protein
MINDTCQICRGAANEPRHSVDGHHEFISSRVDKNCFACGEKIDFEDPNVEVRTNNHVYCGCSEAYSGVKNPKALPMEAFIDKFKRARNAGTPIFAITCFDPAATMSRLQKSIVNGSGGRRLRTARPSFNGTS